METPIYETIGVWVAAILTLAILSFLYKDNPLYKLAEHIFVGVAAGYTICMSFWDVFFPNLFKPLFGPMLWGEKIPEPEEGVWYWLPPEVWRWFLVISLVLGLFFFCRFTKSLSWLSRFSIAFVVGCYAGVNCTGYFQGDLILQVKGSFYPLIAGTYQDLGYPGIEDGVVTWTTILTENLVILIGAMASLTYFFFSKAHRGFLGGTARVGIYFLMVAFGASFGYTVMARVSLFIGRVGFLWEDWIKAVIFGVSG